jgi:hypothetical protein
MVSWLGRPMLRHHRRIRAILAERLFSFFFMFSANRISDAWAPPSLSISYNSTAGPFSEVEGLFTVLMSPTATLPAGHGVGSYPSMTRA